MTVLQKRELPDKVFKKDRIFYLFFIKKKAMYPNIMASCNFCKDSKILTVLDIEGLTKTNIVDFLGHATVPEENAVYLCNKYLGLPNYQEVGKMFDEGLLTL
jgi:hypothetical protein